MKAHNTAMEVTENTVITGCKFLLVESFADRAIYVCDNIVVTDCVMLEIDFWPSFARALVSSRNRLLPVPWKDANTPGFH
jgi:hypothetical protein